ncbi:proton-conducting transporter transmembrane domain-containing protein [Jiulongibacter sp. NS-SX5]|uniref:proton-conducting transporter transmembrane domain-containing protein n=1 Tax=Jiulongibacter sp. NS-SX5 TaxID=3463854 RepID=UPI004058D3DE
MKELSPYLLLFSGPLLFGLTYLFSRIQSGIHPKNALSIAGLASIINLIVVIVSSVILIENGPLESSFWGFEHLGFSLRIDALSMCMSGMIALLAFLIIRFSRNYMAGDQKHGAFIGGLSLTIASVQLMVLSGNLAILFISWIFTGIALNKLILFYKERKGAQIAAKKKNFTARLGDLSLLIAFGLLYNIFQTGNLNDIFHSLENSALTHTGYKIELAALFLVLTAVLKSAQFPTHGWLIEVMEAPTPVSALLHAGLLNAGPFMIIRFAFLMEHTYVASNVLVVIGAVSALFGSLVYLTQTSVKTALAYSSIGHMGFSLMACGLGAFPAAMLHLVSHSFYKAHSFLSSGSQIDRMKNSMFGLSNSRATGFQYLLGLFLSLLIFGGIASLWGIHPVEDSSILIIGGIINMSLSKIITEAIAQKNGTSPLLVTLIAAVIVTVAFFSLESAMKQILVTEIPDAAPITLFSIILVSLVLLTFLSVIMIQVTSSFSTRRLKTLEIHLKNGLYANTYFNRLIGAYKT